MRVTTLVCHTCPLSSWTSLSSQTGRDALVPGSSLPRAAEAVYKQGPRLYRFVARRRGGHPGNRLKPPTNGLITGRVPGKFAGGPIAADVTRPNLTEKTDERQRDGC